MNTGPIKVTESVTVDTNGDLVITDIAGPEGARFKMICKVATLTQLILAYREAIERIDGKDGV